MRFQIRSDVCRYPGTFTVTGDVCRYGGRLPLRRDVCRYGKTFAVTKGRLPLKGGTYKLLINYLYVTYKFQADL